ncbi:Tc toxin subunit A-related protein [Wolbachia endosymbiont (group B) of Agriphila straminella]|uniref:Tc toxin subunit A-related protein n=1 Tax=Wolbachia endosymbiont (group B) of Agriphila straminella TaxID=2953972 RepID=UPI00222649FA|nr:neuraminidase-like domain-containing protein [Wolbachia endosymbiont (group B) of Agriphila straminella]
MTTDSNVVETKSDTKQSYIKRDYCQSVLSPAAYFVKLMEIIEKYICVFDSLDKLGIGQEKVDKLLSFKEGNKLIFDSVCKITSLTEQNFIEEVKDTISEQEARSIYQKAKTSRRSGLKELETRRPDLLELTLDSNNTNKEKLYLEIINHIMEQNLDKKLNEKTLQKLATTKYPFNLPANFPLISIHSYLKKHKRSLAEIYEVLIENADTSAEFLHLSPEEYELIISDNGTEDYLKEVYGIKNGKIEQLKNVDEFITQTGIEKDKLQPLLDSYNKIEGSIELIITGETINNLGNQPLGFLHRFIRLANKLNWSFAELTQALNEGKINQLAIKRIAKIKKLQEKLQQPLAKIFKLYTDTLPEDISRKIDSLPEFKVLLSQKSFKNLATTASNYSTLQNVLEVNSSELTSLIDNDDSKKVFQEEILKIYKQVLLARLINIPIEELLLQLDISGLNLENIESIIELNDWLKRSSLTTQQINSLVNYPEIYKERLSVIEEQVKEKGEQVENFYDIINEYVEIQLDVLVAASEFTKKYAENGSLSVIKLLHNIVVFTELKLSADDINNIKKHGKSYGIEKEWSLKQIKTLINYRMIRDVFSNGSITFLKYTDWLLESTEDQNKVIEEIAHLTGWNKDTLKDLKDVEAFKKCFTKEQSPIDSLIKIKSFMDIVTQLGINSKTLLLLKGLHALKVGDGDTNWMKYTKVADYIKLSTKTEDEDIAVKYFAQQKRDILAKYMIYKHNLKNMRDLYSYLLIDVEMSDCSKISPLKAALNSIQLYIHRCMMKLEKNTEVSGLNEAKWRLLSSYREWEASNKVISYPENYLNPTLRKAATPEYKILQSTLMQGNITSETVNNAYIKYFEDFEQVASLKIVDSCFERIENATLGREENTLFIIGRTITKPYNYYYRTAVFDEEKQEILCWTAWEKIGVSILAETVTPIYAFHRLFIFWVQQDQKKEVDQDNGKILKSSVSTNITINYVFQKPSGSWTTLQDLASDIEVKPSDDLNKLYWKKVAAFYLRGEEKAKNIMISIGNIEVDQDHLSFFLDEDLVASKKKLKFSETKSQSGDDSGNLFYYVCKGTNSLFINFDKNVFKSNITNGDSDEGYQKSRDSVELLGKFRVLSAQPIINKPGWFIVEGNLENENVRELFLLLYEKDDLPSISERSAYKAVDSEKIELEYNAKDLKIDRKRVGFKFVRLNISNNIRKLRQKAYAGGTKKILTLNSQEIRQLKFERFQPFDVATSFPRNTSLDFNGAYGIYLWEVFFYIPMLVAWCLNKEQNFSVAREWYHYILNPSDDEEQRWKFAPLTNRNEESILSGLRNTQIINELRIDPFDPYAIAKQRITSFEKYVIMSYVDNLIDWGDALFAKKSWESLNQATMLYVTAWDLLGYKITRRKRMVETKNFKLLINDRKSSYTQSICDLESNLPPAGTQLTEIKFEAYDVTSYHDYFFKPDNEEFIGLWDKIEDRLYKIRHCLDITGKRLKLPLFQASIDPRQLMQTIGSGSSMGISDQLLPHYRFSYMVAYARSIVEAVIQFGSELLNALEKRDAEILAILYNKHEGIIANFITSIKEKAIEALEEEAKALNVSLSSAESRKLHYEKLIDNGLSVGEEEAINLSNTAVDIRIGAAAIRGAAAVSHLIPTIYGFAVGGFQPGFSVSEGAHVIDSSATIKNEKAQIVHTTESYKRRAEDWELQKTIASHDVEQINYQIDANETYKSNAELDLKIHRKSIEQIKEKEEFFRNKFTNQELYNWMKGQIGMIYFQAYKMALEIVQQVEKTYQYELNSNELFVTNSSWNSLKEGLLAGNILKFTLEQMATKYHNENGRTFEVSKVVSLGQMNPIALHGLRTKGRCKFELTEKLFDLDFPGHYCRKIKNIKITIPAVVGPYENIHASLQQTSNKVVLKPEIEAVKYLLGEDNSNKPGNDILRENWQQNQEIALSRGDQDSGLFELNFNDERYLPFEGTGAVSCWELSLPKATNRIDTNKISDVIIHIDYTSFNDGRLADQVKGLSKLKYYHGMLLVNLSTTYLEAWKKFKQIQSGPYELKFKLSAEIFPTYVKAPKIDLDEDNSIYIIPKASTQIGDMKLNEHVWVDSTYKITINSKIAKPAIDSDWNIKVNNAEISQIEEIAVVIPYKAEINW